MWSCLGKPHVSEYLFLHKVWQHDTDFNICTHQTKVLGYHPVIAISESYAPWDTMITS